MQTDLITKVYFNEHLTHSCVGMPQGLQALSSSCTLSGTSGKCLVAFETAWILHYVHCHINKYQYCTC